jgi:hypothetical protein
MRTGFILAAATLTLAGAITDTEARLRVGRSVQSPRPVPPINGTRSVALGAGIGTAVSIRSSRLTVAGDPEADRPPILRPVLPVIAPVPTKDARAPAERCAKTRLVGSGSGFCEIN